MSELLHALRGRSSGLRLELSLLVLWHVGFAFPGLSTKRSSWTSLRETR